MTTHTRSEIEANSRITSLDDAFRVGAEARKLLDAEFAKGNELLTATEAVDRVLASRNVSKAVPRPASQRDDALAARILTGLIERDRQKQSRLI